MLKGPNSIFSFFPNFWRFWYHKKAHMFLKTHDKFHSLKGFRLEDIIENTLGYGKHN